MPQAWHLAQVRCLHSVACAQQLLQPYAASPMQMHLSASPTCSWQSCVRLCLQCPAAAADPKAFHGQEGGRSVLHMRPVLCMLCPKHRSSAHGTHQLNATSSCICLHRPGVPRPVGPVRSRAPEPRGELCAGRGAGPVRGNGHHLPHRPATPSPRSSARILSSTCGQPTAAAARSGGAAGGVSSGARAGAATAAAAAAGPAAPRPPPAAPGPA